MILKVQLLDNLRPNAKLPSYATPGSSGMDLSAAISLPFSIAPKDYALIPTGISMEIPEGYEGQIRPRSGLAAGFLVVAVPGTIDRDYRGEIKVMLINHHQYRSKEIRPGDRIAQLVISPVARCEVQAASELDATERGAEGFGSTGR